MTHEYRDRPAPELDIKPVYGCDTAEGDHHLPVPGALLSAANSDDSRDWVERHDENPLYDGEQEYAQGYREGFAGDLEAAIVLGRQLGREVRLAVPWGSSTFVPYLVPKED